MSLAAEITHIADTALALRRDNSALKQALRSKQDTIEAQQRRIERLEKTLRAIVAQGVVHRLNVEQLIAEVL